MSEAKKLIKIDKNGTKIYEGLCTCDRCGGRGYIVHHMENGQPSIQWTDGGVCWKCKGEGKVFEQFKEYTPEYRAKLDAQNEKRRQEEYEANGLKWLEKNGFTPDGKTFIFLGDTYSLKDQIKEAGGKFDIIIGWHAAHEIDGISAIEAHVDELAVRNGWGNYDWTARRSEWDEKKRKALLELEGDAGFFGSVGDKIQVEVELVKTATVEYEYFGPKTSYIHVMKDSEGHVFVWKTANFLEVVVDDEYKVFQPGDHFSLKGTIKEHSEYMDQSQTVLTRCKVI